MSSTIPDKSGAQEKSQRDALAEAERKATEHQPESFKDKATGEKVPRIGSDDPDAPIKGIDPAERSGGGR